MKNYQEVKYFYCLASLLCLCFTNPVSYVFRAERKVVAIQVIYNIWYLYLIFNLFWRPVLPCRTCGQFMIVFWSANCRNYDFRYLILNFLSSVDSISKPKPSQFSCFEENSSKIEVLYILRCIRDIYHWIGVWLLMQARNTFYLWS